MDKRDLMLRLLDADAEMPYTPAAFFTHFGPAYHEGQAAIDKHLAYFRQTDMDFVKIQYEKTFPHIPEIRTPADWRTMPVYDESFYAAPLRVVEGLVAEAKDQALVLVTLYSPFMCAGHTTSDAMITAHLKEDPELVKPGLVAITESLMIFVRACIRLGVDGFYASTQGGETHRFPPSKPGSPSIFERYIKPYDRVLMDEIDAACLFNILHVCDYHDAYDDLTPLLDYPGDLVSCPLEVAGRELSPAQASALFGRPVMGGLNRHGVVASGDPQAIRAHVTEVLDRAPAPFVLGADCTVPGDTPWEHLRVAVDLAHERGGA